MFSDLDLQGELCTYADEPDCRALLELYREITWSEAIEPAFERWEEVVPTPDNEDRLALERARRAADGRRGRDVA